MERRLYGDEHEHFRDAVRAFLARDVISNHERWRAERKIDRELWLEAGRHDFLGISMPAELGGAGLTDYRFNAVLSEELAAVGLALASCFGIHVDVVAPYIAELADEEQQERWIPDFCSGKVITAIAMTEPGAGSDLAALRTSAHRDGAEWVINGSKTFITNGMSADLVIVAARTGDGPRGISLFAVEAETKGFLRGRKLDKVGQPEADTAELFFEDMRVPSTAILGRQDGGFEAMMERLPQERLHAAISNLAHARAALEITMTYVKERQAFGQPIGSFQSNRFTLAELVTSMDVTQTYLDRCVEVHCEMQLSPIDAAKAKWWSAELQNDVIDACVQLHGGYGYMTEYDVARAWLDARVSKIWAGSNEIMKELIGRDLGLGDPRPSTAR